MPKQSKATANSADELAEDVQNVSAEDVQVDQNISIEAELSTSQNGAVGPLDEPDLTLDILQKMQGDVDEVYSDQSNLILTPLPVRRSKAAEYFRIRLDGIFHCAMLEEPGVIEPYLVFGPVMAMLGQSIAKPTTIACSVNVTGAEFMLMLPRTEIAPKVLETAQERWCLVMWDKMVQTHRVSVASEELAIEFGDPKFSKFSSFEIMQATFGGRFINEPSHPIAHKFLTRREV